MIAEKMIDAMGYLDEDLVKRTESNADRQKHRGYSLIVVCALVCMILITGVLVLKIFAPTNRTIAAEIDYNMALLSELDTNTIVSSNPYDYRDMENYHNIVELGPAAIEILEEKYVNGELSGMSAYIAAIAIEDIANLSCSNIMGEDWSTADEFFLMWNEMISALPHTLGDIVESEEETEKSIEKIKEYGIFGDYFLASVRKSSRDEIDFYGNSINIKSIKAVIKNSDYLSETSYSAVKIYLEKKLIEGIPL